MLLKFRHLGTVCIVVLAMAASPQVFAKREDVVTGFVAMTCSKFLGYAAETKDAKWFIDLANRSGAAFLGGLNTAVDWFEVKNDIASVKLMPETDVYYWYLKKNCADKPNWAVRDWLMVLWGIQPAKEK